MKGKRAELVKVLSAERHKNISLIPSSIIVAIDIYNNSRRLQDIGNYL